MDAVAPRDGGGVASEVDALREENVALSDQATQLQALLRAGAPSAPSALQSPELPPSLSETKAHHRRGGPRGGGVPLELPVKALRGRRPQTPAPIEAAVTRR